MIKKVKDKYVLYSLRTGKVLGKFNGLQAAQNRERQINYFKHRSRQ